MLPPFFSLDTSQHATYVLCPVSPLLCTCVTLLYHFIFVFLVLFIDVSSAAQIEWRNLRQ